MKKSISTTIATVTTLLYASPVQAAITNPIISRADGTDPAAGFAFYFAQLWKTLVIVGGLAFLVYLVLGGLDRVLAGGDKAKLESSNKRITNAVIGLVILVGSFAVVMFVSEFLGFDLLNIVWPTS